MRPRPPPAGEGGAGSDVNNFRRPEMAISKELLDILVCPICKTPVELKQDENALKCHQCKRVYPIRDDIPVMLVDEARIEE